MFTPHARTALVALLAFGAFAAPASAKKPRPAQKTPSVLTDPGFSGLTGAQQLARLTEQTGGGKLALINGRRCVRYPDGTLVRI